MEPGVRGRTIAEIETERLLLRRWREEDLATYTRICADPLERIISIIQPGNLASRSVAEKAGLYVQDETRWQGNDVIWYAVDRPDWEAARADT